MSAVSPKRSPVGSRAGARTVGSGGCSTAFAVGLSPAPLATSPAPATSNGAGGFPALRSPARFTPRLMRPAVAAALSALAHGHRLLHLARPAPPSPWRISSVSTLLRAHPPPSRRQPTSRCCRLYGLPSFRGFPRGTRRASPVACCALVAVLSLTTPPERSAASIGLRRAMLPSPSRLRARPPGLLPFGATTR